MAQLRPDSIVDRWEALVEGAADRGEDFLNLLEGGLSAAGIPGGCTWELRGAESARGGCELVVRVQRLPDLRVYVEARDYGVHLQVSRIITLEPGWWKRSLAERIHGDPFALSLPGDVARQQELSAFVAVVQHCVKRAAEDMLGPRIRRGALRIRRTMS